MSRLGARARLSLALGAVAVTWSCIATAQQGGAAPPSDGYVVPTEGGAIVVTPGSQTSRETYVPPVGFPGPDADLNPGLPSSSKPITDTSRSSDGFDLNEEGFDGGDSTLRGGKNAPMLSGRSAIRVPDMHVVRRGDTLWDISAHYFRNPYRWPQLWSYNPQVVNPHYIYPGDQLRLRGSARGGEPLGDAYSGMVGRDSLVPRETVFLRNEGFIGSSEEDVWGRVSAAYDDQSLLSEGDTVYLQLKEGVEVSIGQRLTVFRPVREPNARRGARRPPGKIVAIKGTVQVTHWNPEKHVARARIIESLEVIERGFQVGPVGRRFDVVPPRRNEAEREARILDTLKPRQLLGQNQVVFIDKGSEDGVRPGHRFKVVRRGDQWRRTLTGASGMASDRIRTDLPDEVEIEPTPIAGNEKDFPDEEVGELRVLRTQKYSSIALVTESNRELVPGDRLHAPKGY